MLPRAPEVTLTAEKPAVAASTPQLIPKIYHPVGCNRSPRWAYACRDRPSELRRCPENPPNSLPDLWSSQVCAYRLRHRAGSRGCAPFAYEQAPRTSAIPSQTHLNRARRGRWRGRWSVTSHAHTLTMSINPFRAPQTPPRPIPCSSWSRPQRTMWKRAQRNRKSSREIRQPGLPFTTLRYHVSDCQLA